MKAFKRFIFGFMFAAVALVNASAFELFGSGNDGEETLAGIMTFMNEYLAQSGKDYKQNYEILQNALKQLETQAKQLETQIKEATGYDFGSIGFSGPSDKIKGSKVYGEAKNAWDALSNAGEKLQKMYSDIQSVYDALESASISIDGVGYSIADIAGAGLPKRDMGCFGTAVVTKVDNKFGDKAQDWADSLTPEQQLYINRKFGYSAKDYYLLQQLRNQEADMTLRLMARTDERIDQVKSDRQAVNEAIKQANAQLNAADITDKQISLISAKQINTIAATLESMKEIQQDNITKATSESLKRYNEEQSKKNAEEAVKKAWGRDLYADDTPDYWLNPNPEDDIFEKGKKTGEEKQKQQSAIDRWKGIFSSVKDWQD